MCYRNVRFVGLYWLDESVDHLAASHEVTPEDIEEIIYGIEGEDPNYLVVRDGDFYVVYGRTGGGRLLTIVGELMLDGRYRPFGARTMTDSERRRYLRRRG
jgi:uncharacterized DUF497 family protein